MTRLCPSHQVVVERVLRGLRAARPRSYLLKAPPGCGPPRALYQAVRNGLQEAGDAKRAVAMLSADMVRDDRELVSQLVGAWIAERAEIKLLWEGALDPEMEPQYLLQAFGDLARRHELKLVAIVPRFGKLFSNGRMKGEVLAALRELEHDDLLASVNGATLSYRDLYDQRARLEPNFTSEYGTNHVTEPFGRLSREDGQELWTASGHPLQGRLDRHYFETAFGESGGILDPFECALALVELPLATDPRPYNVRLRAALPETFTRILEPEGADAGDQAICDACAHLYLGDEEPNLSLLMSARWKDILTWQDESGAVQLVCESIGRRAVELMYRRKGAIPPEKLYEAGQYKLCLSRFSQAPVRVPLLRIAAEMMASVFADSRHDLYFGADVPWKKVAELARKGVSQTSGNAAREFQRWEQIADAHARFAPSPRGALARLVPRGELDERSEIEAVALYLGLRFLAVRSRPPEQAAYLAISLPEEALRAYVVLVLGTLTAGRAFDGISPEVVAKWWPGQDPFVPPLPDEELTMSGLALLAAIRSSERGHPLFPSSANVGQILGDELRNQSAHHVITADADRVRRQLGYAEDFLERLTRDGGCSFQLEDIGRFARPPRAFLEASGAEEQTG